MKYKESIYNIKLKEFFSNTDLAIENDAVYNTMSGKIGTLPSNVDYDNPPSSLIKNRFVVPSSYDETKHHIECSNRIIHADKPNSVILEIAATLKCNYHCSYCFEKCSRDIDMTDEMLQEYIKYIKNEIDRNESLKTFHLIWFGGEPLLRMDVINKISSFVIPYCEEREIKYSATIVTNGYLYTKEISESLRRLKVKSAQITIDGFEDTYNKFRNPPQNAFQTVIQNIESSAIPVTIRLHTLPTTRSEILEMAKYLSELDSLKKIKKKIWVSRVLEYTRPFTFGLNDTEWLEFREKASTINNHIKKVLTLNDWSKPSHYSCRFIGARNVCLSPDGYLYRCSCHIGLKEFSVGTIKDGINENCKTNKDYVSQILSDDCKQCVLLPVCNGGPCRYEYLQGIDNCEYMKNKFKQNLRFYIELEQLRKVNRRLHSALPLKENKSLDT